MKLSELILDPGMLPFAIALGVVMGMLAIELLLMQLGASLLGGSDSDLDAAGPDGDFAFDADPGFDPGFELDPSLDADLDLGAESPVTGAAAGAGADHALSWLGLGKVPFSIWLAGTLTAFGVAGYLLQLGAVALVGAMIPAGLAAGVALLPGIGLGARFAEFIGRVMPKSETTAISRRSFGNRLGVITVGTARRGHPAQARFKDGHGNTHYAMVEPFRDADALAQGTEIIILRLRDGSLRALSLDDDAVSKKQ